MTRRTRIQLGLTAVATAIAAAVSACTDAPLGRTEYCYYYFTLASGPTSTTTTTVATSTTAGPPTTIDFLGQTWVGELQCFDEPQVWPPPNVTVTTLAGYPAPVSAGTRTVK